MKRSFNANLYVALIHYPVVNKAGDTIASAVTNLDLHDISRAAKTYGVHRFYVVTPLADQQRLIQRIIAHWADGAGARYNPKRREAMALIRVADTFDEVMARVRANGGGNPKTVATSAKQNPGAIRFRKMRSLIQGGAPHVLVFGTAWGLAESVTTEADYVLAPIEGLTAYNHLSVRSAAAIILDRLLGTDE